ncbi:MAG: hypothetical protein DMG35_18750 [Acidobacteria bacterium]|nr:MAG: hypothetical protein DMG35_18750 [Acidobacteriota bacterium]
MRGGYRGVEPPFCIRVLTNHMQGWSVRLAGVPLTFRLLGSTVFALLNYLFSGRRIDGVAQFQEFRVIKDDAIGGAFTHKADAQAGDGLQCVDFFLVL